MNNTLDKKHSNNISLLTRLLMKLPLLTIFLGLFLILFNLIFTIPFFIFYFDKNNIEMPLPTIVLLEFSEFVNNYLFNWFAMIAIIILVVAVIIIIKIIKSMNLYSKIIVFVPIKNTIEKQVNLFYFCSSLKNELDNNISLIESIDRAVKEIPNSFVKREYEEIIHNMKIGKTFIQAMSLNKYVPKYVKTNIITSEEPEELSQSLYKTLGYIEKILILSSFNQVLLLAILFMFINFVMLFLTNLPLMPPYANY